MQARGPEGPAELLDTRTWFGRSAPVVLEIGSGTGTSTLAMAKAEPHIDVVAVEVYRRGLAQLLSAIAREGVTNIRLVRGDGVDVLEHMFGPESLTGVRVFFPDPWPKARHHKRRLLQPDTRRPDRRPAAARRCAARRNGPRRVRRADRRVRRRRTPAAPRHRPDDGLPISVARPITKYETKARDAGSAVAELLWEKLPR